MLWVLVSSASEALLKSTHSVCQFTGKYILFGQVDFYYLLVDGQVIKFDYSQTLLL